MSSSPPLGGLPPPPGVTPNFVDPPSRQGQIIAAVGICLAFTTLLVCVRLYTVFCIIKSHGWADCEYNASALEDQPNLGYLDCSFISWVFTFSLPSISMTGRRIKLSALL